MISCNAAGLTRVKARRLAMLALQRVATVPVRGSAVVLDPASTSQLCRGVGTKGVPD